MSEVNSEKIVEFGEYCHQCLHYEKAEDQSPCDDCLENPVNIDSHKPVNFVKNEKKNL